MRTVVISHCMDDGDDSGDDEERAAKSPFRRHTLSNRFICSDHVFASRRSWQPMTRRHAAKLAEILAKRKARKEQEMADPDSGLREHLMPENLPRDEFEDHLHPAARKLVESGVDPNVYVVRHGRDAFVLYPFKEDIAERMERRKPDRMLDGWTTLRAIEHLDVSLIMSECGGDVLWKHGCDVTTDDLADMAIK